MGLEAEASASASLVGNPRQKHGRKIDMRVQGRLGVHFQRQLSKWQMPQAPDIYSHGYFVSRLHNRFPSDRSKCLVIFMVSGTVKDVLKPLFSAPELPNYSNSNKKNTNSVLGKLVRNSKHYKADDSKKTRA